VDRVFRDLPGLLQPGDLLVFNDTQVIKARLFGEKSTGGKVELLVERVLADHEVVAHMKVSKKPAVGGVIHLAGGCTATLTGRWPDDNGALFRFRFSQEPHAVMQAHGHVPLPPYITHEDTAEDERRYQTVFARNPGAVAAPTASLHFDAAVLDALRERGVHTAEVTLHVGAGTFQPMRVDDIRDHRMHSEWLNVGAELVQQVRRTRAAGGRVIAVGTTVLRALESALVDGDLQPFAGETNIFIFPGYHIRSIDALLTNFHLPESTLLMLVSAFAGKARVFAAYEHAVRERYRFFSYGDAMLLFPAQDQA
jgi:S-adenosylmethionine:tRNA ribosyltransferase-isomerase